MPKRANSEGTIYQRSDGRWCAQVTFHADDGATRRTTVYGRTRQEVLGKKRLIDRHRDDGLPVTTRLAPTVKEFGTVWCEQRLRDEVTLGRIRPNTADSYAGLWTGHIEPALGRHRLDALRPNHILGWLAAMKTKQSARGGPLADRTCVYAFAVLRRALNDAVREGLLSRNPCDLVRGSSVRTKGTGTALTKEEAGRLLKALTDEDDRALWTLQLSMGLRIGETLALTWSDLDLEAARLTVARSVGRVRRELNPNTGLRRTELEVHEPKTPGSAATLAMPAGLVGALKHHRVAQTRVRLAASVWCENDLVFPSSIGTHQDARNVGRRWANVRAMAKIERPVRLHDLRHSTATFLLTAGTPMRVIMELLRHTRIATTADLYAHVAEEVTDAAAAAMDGLLTELLAAGDAES